MKNTLLIWNCYLTHICLELLRFELKMEDRAAMINVNSKLKTSWLSINGCVGPKEVSSEQKM